MIVSFYAVLAAALTAALATVAARPANAAQPATAPAPAASPAPATSAPPGSPQAQTAAQNDPCAGPGGLLATVDRPTLGYSACAVANGALVLEDGYQNTFTDGPRTSVSAVYPESFTRFGAAPSFELDVIGPSFNRMRAGASITTGYSDLGLGFKYELPQAGRFTYALDGLFTAATGSGGFSNGGPSQTLNLDVAYALGPAMGLATTLAGSSAAGAGPAGTARYGTFNPSVVVTAQLPHYYQFYAELNGQTRTAPQAGGRVASDFGVQKLLGENLVVDAEYGLEFTPERGSRFNYIGTGFALRVK